MSSALFSPFSLGSLTLPNRIVVSPMCQYSAEDGSATAWHRTHLATLSQSGAALMFLEASAVEAIGRISAGDLGLYSDANEHALATILAEVRRHSPIAIGIQLAHAGRKASTRVPWDQGGAQLAPDAPGGWQTVSASALPHLETEHPPVALDTAGIARVREAFVHSARRAARLGLDAIELHFAHGYLVHEFLSPISNRRTDAYGGTFEHRIRLALEIFEAVRAVWARPLGVRVSATDWVDGGWDVPQTVQLARALRERGCDWIDCSSGGISPKQQIAIGPGYQLPFARTVRAEAGIPTIGVGMITEPAQAEAAIRDGVADLVALARAMLWDPRWPWHAAAALGASVEVSPQYLRAVPHGVKGVFIEGPARR